MRPDDFEIVLLTGFLGSGKTTLLKAFLVTEEAADTGVIVNEIGEIDVDGAVLAQSAGKVPLTLLSNGCICCTPNGDLAGAIAMLHEERARSGHPPLRRVVVETSGAARPGQVLRGLQLLGHVAHTTCVSTFDARDWKRALGTPEGRAQVAGSQRIVVTKLDCVTEEQAQAAFEAARSANPLAELVTARLEVERARLALLPSRCDGRVPSASTDEGASIGRIDTAIMRFTAPILYVDLADWLDNVAGLLGERLYRTKGFVRLHGPPHRLLVQGVGTTFAEPTPFAGLTTESFLVLIGDGLDADELRGVEPDLPACIAVSRPPASRLGRSLTQTLAR